MKIRTQLAVAFLLLAILPLAVIVLYNYLSSRAAVRQAVESESSALAAEMRGRMDEVRDDLARRIERLGELPLGDWLDGPPSEAEARALRKRVALEMGEAARLVQAFELVPTAPFPPRPPRPAPPRAAPESSAEPGKVAREVDTGFGSFVIYLPELEEAEAPPAPDAPPSGLEVDIGQLVAGGLDLAGRVLEGLGEELAELEELERLEAEGELSTAAAAERRRELEDRLAAKAKGLAAGGPGVEGEPSWITEVRRMSRREREEMREVRESSERVLGRRFDVPLRRGDRVIGEVRAQVSAEEIVRRVLEHSERGAGEIPFAIDDEGELYVADEAHRSVLEGLPLDAGEPAPEVEDWVIVTEEDPDSGLTFGIARPIRRDLTALRANAGRNLAYGLGLVALAVIGVLPLSRHMTRDLEDLDRGARRIAGGDLETRVPVRSSDEIGHLASTFNHMVEELQEQRARLLEGERRRREQEVERSLLEAEYERKSRELEDARAFQLSMLPRRLPEPPGLELAVHMRTAAEVGGDYYDFHLGSDGALVAAIGDATGHGARAGTMVTVVKSLFSAHLPGLQLAAFLEEASRAIKRMGLERMAMALTLVRIDGRELTVAAAGMPPVLLHRASTGDVEEIALEGMPLGGLEGFLYRERRLELEAGDTLLLQSDGFPELTGADGEPLGYVRARECFARCAGGSPEQVVAGLVAHVDERTGGAPPPHDVHFVVVRVEAS